MTDIIYSSHDNPIILQFKINGVIISDHNNLTNIELLIDSNIFSLVSNPSIFDVQVDKVIVFLGLSSLPTGTYEARIVGYDIDNTNGIVYDDALTIRIK